MKKTIWIKPFKKAYHKEDAEAVADTLRKAAQPSKNLIYNARAVQRRGTDLYEVEIMTTVTNMFVRSAAGRAA